jgi:hypothetical protein
VARRVRGGAEARAACLYLQSGEAEMQLAFSALRDLLDPLYEEFAEALAAPQRRALDVALLRAEPDREHPAHDRGRVAAAALGFLEDTHVPFDQLQAEQI